MADAGKHSSTLGGSQFSNISHCSPCSRHASPRLLRIIWVFLSIGLRRTARTSRLSTKKHARFNSRNFQREGPPEFSRLARSAEVDCLAARIRLLFFEQFAAKLQSKKIHSLEMKRGGKGFNSLPGLLLRCCRKNASLNAGPSINLSSTCRSNKVVHHIHNQSQACFQHDQETSKKEPIAIETASGKVEHCSVVSQANN